MTIVGPLQRLSFGQDGNSTVKASNSGIKGSRLRVTLGKSLHFSGSLQQAFEVVVTAEAAESGAPCPETVNGSDNWSERDSRGCFAGMRCRTLFCGLYCVSGSRGALALVAAGEVKTQGD